MRARPAAAVAAAAFLAACGSRASQSAAGSATRPASPTAEAVPGLADLKYRVIDAIGDIAFCDPDYYPLERVGGEQANAARLLPAIMADITVYAAIRAHLHLAEPLTADQHLAVYRQWKTLNALSLQPRDGAFDFHQVTHGDSGRLTAVTGNVTADGTVTVTSREPGVLNCPICLAPGTLIDTPLGPRRVAELRAGMPVFTLDKGGRRLCARIRLTGSSAVPPTHSMIRLALADGRSVAASPGHPLADGRHFSSVGTGDTVDGSRVIDVSREACTARATWDLLPSGPTGLYWADGVLLASTLAIRRALQAA